MSKKRNDPNRKRVKEQLIENYGCVCMVCEQKKERKDITMHHITKFAECRVTKYDECGLVCVECHREINIAENKDIAKYEQTNLKIRWYKYTH